MEKPNLQIKLLKQLISFNLNRHTDTGSSSLLPGIVRVPRTKYDLKRFWKYTRYCRLLFNSDRQWSIKPQSFRNTQDFQDLDNCYVYIVVFFQMKILKKNHCMWIDTSVEMTSFGIELILFCHILTIIGRRNLKNAWLMFLE